MQNYFRVPNSVFDLGVSTSALVVLIYLYRCQNNKSEAFPSYNTIAKKCNIERRTAIRVINSLIDRGLIRKKLIGRVNHYRIN